MAAAVSAPIQIWRFEDAPEELRAMEPRGGKWLALIPHEHCGEIAYEWRPLLLDAGIFKTPYVSQYKHADGWVLIGSGK